MRAARIVERLIATGVLMLAIAVFVFFFMRYLPGDPVDLIMGQEGNISQQQIDLLKAQYRLDEPLHIQLASFLGGVLRGDLGTSIVQDKPVGGLILARFPATIELALGALVFALAVALPIGTLSAYWRNSPIDRLSMASAFVGISMPGFWLGIVLIMLFAVHLKLLPVGGRATVGLEPQHITGFYLLDSLLTRDGRAFIDSLKHLILPSVTLGAVMAALLARVVRSSMLDALSQDYVRLARAKGVHEVVVVAKHALRNALIPTVTILGLEIGTLLGGNMIVETVFAWPGIGRLVVDAIFARDYPLVQGVVMIYACTFALANLAVDIAYTYLNPKIAL
ncbi:MAG: ABC transporter permease [Sphaerobacter sp.]|nr:ABC transporter permease [Sphaerobacter sp.]